LRLQEDPHSASTSTQHASPPTPRASLVHTATPQASALVRHGVVNRCGAARGVAADNLLTSHEDRPNLDSRGPSRHSRLSYHLFDMSRRQAANSGTGSRHHWLPASFVAGFSSELTEPRRSRHIWVLRRGQTTPWRTTCSRVAARTNLYTLNQAGKAGAVDRTWDLYEAQLPKAIDALVNSGQNRESVIGAKVWLRTLVPFVASIFIRGPDFDERYRKRALNKDSSPYYSIRGEASFLPSGELDTTPPPIPSTRKEIEDNVNLARLVELQRLLVPIMAARWIVLHFRDDDEWLLTNDLGYIPGTIEGVSEHGAIVPLDRRTALALVPQRRRQIITGSLFHGWQARIEHRELRDRQVTELNRRIAMTCQEMVLGGSQKLLLSNAADLGSYTWTASDSPFIQAFPRDVLWAAETDWFRLSCTLAQYQPGDARVRDFELDYSLVAREKLVVSLLILTGDRPRLPESTTLSVDGNDITISIPRGVVMNRHGRGGLLFIYDEPVSG